MGQSCAACAAPRPELHAVLTVGWRRAEGTFLCVEDNAPSPGGSQGARLGGHPQVQLPGQRGPEALPVPTGVPLGELLLRPRPLQVLAAARPPTWAAISSSVVQEGARLAWCFLWNSLSCQVQTPLRLSPPFSLHFGFP